MNAQKIVPFIWFESGAADAAKLYTSIFKNSRIVTKVDAPQNNTGVTFELDGVAYTAFNGGPMFKLNESFSIMVQCETQEEVDYYWNALTADGGQESMCGWLKDKFGLSWQITPSILMKGINDPNRKKADAMFAAMLKMKKLNVAELQRAYDNA